jgi:hypothetical protein
MYFVFKMLFLVCFRFVRFLCLPKITILTILIIVVYYIYGSRLSLVASSTYTCCLRRGGDVTHTPANKGRSAFVTLLLLPLFTPKAHGLFYIYAVLSMFNNGFKLLVE